MIRAPLLLALLFCGGSLHGEPAPVVPVSAADLLGVLPKAPEHWKLVESTAEEGIDRWLYTKARRVYQPVPAFQNPANPTAPPPAAPASVEIVVTDTGRFAEAFGDFVDFQPGKNGPVERLLLSGQPALVITAPPEDVITQIAAGQRFLIEITVKALPAVKAEDWLRLLNFTALPPAAPGEAKVPATVRRVFVDELNPARNRARPEPAAAVSAALRAAGRQP